MAYLNHFYLLLKKSKSNKVKLSGFGTFSFKKTPKRALEETQKLKIHI
jgi:nucleoid DNA-binding protein